MSIGLWCHPAISSSVVPFSSCFQSFLTSGSFPMSQCFVSCGQSIGVSASALVLPVKIQDWFPFKWTGWISLGLAVSSPAPQLKSINSLALSFLYSPILTSKHDYLKNHSFDYMDLYTLLRFVIAFSSKEQASFNFMAAGTIFHDFGKFEEIWGLGIF